MIKPGIQCVISLMTLQVQIVSWQCRFCLYMLHSVWLVWLLYA